MRGGHGQFDQPCVEADVAALWALRLAAHAPRCARRSVQVCGHSLRALTKDDLLSCLHVGPFLRIICRVVTSSARAIVSNSCVFVLHVQTGFDAVHER